MTLTFLANANDRQATKADLVDIARALGLPCDALTGLEQLRNNLRACLNANLRQQGRARVDFNRLAYNGRQVTKAELLAYAHALGSALPATSQIPVVKLRKHIRAWLERIVADKTLQKKRFAEAERLPAGEAPVLTVKLTHQEVNVLLEALETRSVLPSVRALRDKLEALLPQVG